MEDSRVKTVRDICKHIGSVVCDNPRCVETGCTYVVDEDNLVHTTTNNLFEHIVCPKDGFLFSLDIDDEHLYIAEELLYSIPCETCAFELMEGDSVREMTFLAKRFRDSGVCVDVLCVV